MNGSSDIERLVLSSRRLPTAFSGLRILHLSDLHIIRWTRRLERWREALSALRIDLMVITGDIGHRSWHWKASLDGVVRLVSDIAAPLGKFFILGNHDALELGPALHDRGLIPLMNASYILRKGANEMALVGLAQHKRIDTDIPAALAEVPPATFKLMLMHYPDLIHAAAAAEIDICLAGHTHGGQICYPDGSPIIRHDVLPNYMCTGVHKVASTWLVVNRGIGKAGLRVRMFCPPHAIVLKLQTGEDGIELAPEQAPGRLSN